MEILREFTWVDLALITVLAGALFVGYTQGILRYVLSGLVVIAAFVAASQLKGPVTDALAIWTPTTPELKELWIFIGTFVGLTVAGWFTVRALFRKTRLPVFKPIDEIGGAALGVVFAALVITFSLIVMDTFFEMASPAEVANSGFLKDYYDGMNSSVIVRFLRETVIPTAGFVARPFVPAEIAAFLNLQ